MIDCAYAPSGTSSSSGSPLDSCLYCGRTEVAHRVVPPEIEFQLWGGRRLLFASPDAARASGFVLHDAEVEL